MTGPEALDAMNEGKCVKHSIGTIFKRDKGRYKQWLAGKWPAHDIGPINIWIEAKIDGYWLGDSFQVCPDPEEQG